MSIRAEAKIYTDGSCLNNPGPGGWAAIVIVGQQEIELVGGENWTTNNRMELLGVIHGLKALKGPHIVTVTSDSKYVTDAFNQNWIKSWKANGWARKEGELMNADLWKELDRLVSLHSCSFVWIKGHNGHEMNERANTLAQAESQKQTAMPRGFQQEPSQLNIFEDEPCPGENHIISCLDSMIHLRNTEKYGVDQPCGSDPWCDICICSGNYNCANAYSQAQGKGA